MTFPVLSSDLYKLSFADLLSENQLTLRLYKKLVNYARLTTVGDLYTNYRSVDDFIERVPSTGPKIQTQLTDMLDALVNRFNPLDQCVMPYQGPEEIPSVSHFPDVAFPDFDAEKRQITFDVLHKKGLIDNLLHNKLTRDAGLICVGDLVDKFNSIESFIKSIPYTGSSTNKRIVRMLDMLEDDPAALAAQATASGVQLPYEYDSNMPLAESMRRLLIDSITELKQIGKVSKQMQGPVAEQVFIHDRTYEETGLLTNLTRERVRQIREKLIDGFRAWFVHGTTPLLEGFYVEEALRLRINSLINQLRTDFGDIATDDQVVQWLMQQGIILNPDDTITRRFFLMLAQAELTGKTESRFSKSRFYVLNPAFRKADFLKVGELTLDVLADLVIPQSANVIVLAVNQLLKKEKVTLTKELRINLAAHVQNALLRLPEVEQLRQLDDSVYQLFFADLSQLCMAERVLNEEGRAMYYSEIIQGIQERLLAINVQRSFDESSLKHQLGNCKRIKHYGKNSLYSIKHIGQANDRGYGKLELAIKAIETAQKPLSIPDINAYINNFLVGQGVPGDQSQKSTASLLSYALKQNNDVCRLQDGRYILKKWADQYADSLETSSTKAARATNGSLLNKVQAILTNAPEQTMIRRKLTRQLVADGHPRPSIGSVFNQALFEQFEQEGNVLIRLRQDVNFTPKILKKEQIKERIITLLSSLPDRRLPMRAIVKQIEKEFTLTKTQRPVVNKVITENPRLFFKETDDMCRVTLLVTPGELEKAKPYDAEKDWPVLLHYVMKHVEVVASPLIQHSFSTLADRFHRFALAEVPCDDLEGIRLLPWYLWNYYTNPDSQATHLYARAVIASVEPYLQKVLYVANHYYFEEFQHMQPDKKGIGQLMKKLYKADPWKSPATKAVYEKAKQARNSIAHTAQVWDPSEERSHVQVCLSYMLYVGDCYYADLNKYQAE